MIRSLERDLQTRAAGEVSARASAALAAVLCIVTTLPGCPPSASLRGGRVGSLDDGLSPVHVHNAGAREVTLVVGELRDPSAFDCALILEGERLSVHAFALRTVHLAPGANLALEGVAGDGSCGAVQLTSSGLVRALAWRSDAVPRVEVPAYGVIDAPGRVDVDEAGFVVPSAGTFSEVAIAP